MLNWPSGTYIGQAKKNMSKIIFFFRIMLQLFKNDNNITKNKLYFLKKIKYKDITFIATKDNQISVKDAGENRILISLS